MFMEAHYSLKVKTMEKSICKWTDFKIYVGHGSCAQGNMCLVDSAEEESLFLTEHSTGQRDSTILEATVLDALLLLWRDIMIEAIY